MTTIYVALNEDGTVILWYLGTMDPGDGPWGTAVPVQSSDKIYHDYYLWLVSVGMSGGAVEPD